MNSKQIRTMSYEDIQKKIDELRKEMIKLNTQVSSGANMKNPSLIKKTKKTIARLLQELQNKEEKKEK